MTNTSAFKWTRFWVLSQFVLNWIFTQYRIIDGPDDDWYPSDDYFSYLHRFLDNSSEFFLPHLRSFKFVTGSPSNTETFTLLCNTLMTNTTLLELDIEFHELTDSEVTPLAEVFSFNNTLKKISLTGRTRSFYDRYSDLVLFNGILPLFNSSSLKKIEFSDVRLDSS
ncbi:hypothetical protein GEMRC1_014089 [Eukaryota sp. GEM-RC1]